MGLNVAMWTVDSKENYLKYGQMGVYMMTCNSLRPSEMPELEDINWESDALEQTICDAVAVEATDWYTINGMSVSSDTPQDGIFISVSSLCDGTVQTRKFLKR